MVGSRRRALIGSGVEHVPDEGRLLALELRDALVLLTQLLQTQRDIANSWSFCTAASNVLLADQGEGVTPLTFENKFTVQIFAHNFNISTFSTALRFKSGPLPPP